MTEPAAVLGAARALWRPDPDGSPQTPDDPAVERNARICRRFAFACGAIICVVGAVVLFGWIFGIESLSVSLHGVAKMKANTALALMSLGGAIVLIAAANTRAETSTAFRAHLRSEHAAAGLAAAAGVIGVLTLIEFIAGADLKIDQLIAHDGSIGVTGANPGRTAELTAFLMICSSVALILTAQGRPRSVPVTEWLAVVTALIAGFVVIDYAYGADVLFKVHGGAPIAASTAACLWLVAIGILNLRPLDGWMRMITGSGAGSAAVRLLLPLAVIGIPAAGWAYLAGLRAGVFGKHSGVAVMALVVVAVCGVAVLWVGTQLNRQQRQRIRSEGQHDSVQALLDSLVANSQAMIAIHDSEGRYVLVNHAVERWTGLSREALIGHTVADVLSAKDATIFEDLRARMLAAGSAISNEGYVGEGADRVYVLSNAFPVKSADRSFDGMGVIATDITEYKEQEELTRQLNIDLEREAAHTREVVSELETFAHTVSHDLRSPLRAIDGFTQVVQSEYGETIDERGRRYLDRVREGAKAMGELIDGLLEFSRLGRSELVPSELDMTEIARAANEQLAFEREGRDVHVAIEDLPAARADRQLMSAVFTNLLSNAYKYTRTRDVAEIEVGASLAESGHPTTYYVRDNGIGFEMQYADKLFDVFERLNRSEDYEGSGVGLATVQRIVRRHGGCIWAQSEPGRGTTMFFQLSRE